MYYKRLEELRLKTGLTKREIAEKFNIAESTYGKWELGKRKPDLDTLSSLAEFFDVSADYLLGKTMDPTPSRKKKPTPETVGPVLTSVLKEAGYLKDGNPLTDEEADRLLKYLMAIHEADSKGNK